MNLQKKNIFIGLSGGVDSAVSAALLKEQGAQVTGVFIKGWYPPEMPCTWTEERRDAMRVAARLSIPFLTLDASTEYRQHVIEYLLSEYREGRTPNPDIMCNKEIKFGLFYRFAKEHGADSIAMGHYRSGEKDQSYFLWSVPKDILEATIFPVGDMTKSEVRRLAKVYNLPVAEKKDSQGICFLGNVSVNEFLRKEFGTSNPALLHTLGQRVPLPDGPWYVVKKDVSAGKIEISKNATTDDCVINFKNANWHDDSLNIQYAQYRYRGPRIMGRVANNQFRSDRAFPDLPSPGQSIVFFSSHGLVGGGIIE